MNQLSRSIPFQEGGYRLVNPTTQQPLISIITVVYNAQTTLEATILSVLQQSSNNLEYILIDGGSTDRTLAIIKQYEYKITYWRSEPDLGIYDAMNKGIYFCTGKLIGILNSGDRYTKDTLATVINYHLPYSDRILTGDCQINSHIEPGNIKQLPYRMIPHASVFVPLEIYQQQGLFNLNFSIAADYEFLCRCYSKNIPFVYIDQILTNVSPRGFSSNYYLAETEFMRVRLRYQLISPGLAIIISLWSFFKITIRQLLKL